jgi:hypothetical protein
MLLASSAVPCFRFGSVTAYRTMKLGSNNHELPRAPRSRGTRGFILSWRLLTRRVGVHGFCKFLDVLW